ncbi:uncharacterized protein LOC120348092 isoform X1 [Styela clava]
MEELERRIVEDIKSELVLNKRERQRLAEKLDCLILLIRRAWEGENESINKISEIVGIPSPKIIPSPRKRDSENEQLGQEYLQLTSTLLDEQLQVDASIKKTTKVLRPSSGKRIKSANRSRVRPSSQRSATSKTPARFTDTTKNISTTNMELSGNNFDPLGKTLFEQQPNLLDETDNFKMSNLTDVLPLFSEARKETKYNQPINMNATQNYQVAAHSRKFDDKNFQGVLFDPDGVIPQRKPRPLSAALQQRQDYLRSQAIKKKPRPHTAKPAFRHVSDIEYDTIIRTHHGQQSPVSSPENKLMDVSLEAYINNGSKDNPISVNISSKSPTYTKVGAISRNSFSDERDQQSFGDVTDALHHVQEMERMFRRNTRKLQQKIGIPAEGCI